MSGLCDDNKKIVLLHVCVSLNISILTGITVLLRKGNLFSYVVLYMHPSSVCLSISTKRFTPGCTLVSIRLTTSSIMLLIQKHALYFHA